MAEGKGRKDILFCLLPIPGRSTGKSIFNGCPDCLFPRSYSYHSGRVSFSSAYELAKDPALSFPAMEAESMSCQVSDSKRDRRI